MHVFRTLRNVVPNIALKINSIVERKLHDIIENTFNFKMNFLN